MLGSITQEAEYQKEPGNQIANLILAVFMSGIPTLVFFLGNIIRKRPITSFDWQLVFGIVLLQWTLIHFLSELTNR